LQFADAQGAPIGSTQVFQFDAVGFALRPLRISAPATSASVEVRLALPPTTSLTVEQLALTPRSTVKVPLGFIAQSPGELHVSNARIVYDEGVPAPPAPPAAGLSEPTPPGSDPGDPECCACEDDESAGSITGGKEPGVPLPPPARTVLDRKQTERLVQRLLLAQDAVAVVPLTSVRGVGTARAKQLEAAGIHNANELAHATSERVFEALANSPAITHELAGTLVLNAIAALPAAQRPVIP
jgi:hypothetical protein